MWKRGKRVRKTEGGGKLQSPMHFRIARTSRKKKKGERDKAVSPSSAIYSARVRGNGKVWRQVRCVGTEKLAGIFRPFVYLWK